MSSIINKIYHKQPPRDGYIAPTNTPTFHEGDYMPVSPSYNLNPNNDDDNDDGDVFYNSSPLYNLAEIAISRDKMKTPQSDINSNRGKLLVDYWEKKCKELWEDKQGLYKDLRKNDMEKQALSDKYYEILQENKALSDKYHKILQENKDLKNRLQYAEKAETTMCTIGDIIATTQYRRELTLQHQHQQSIVMEQSVNPSNSELSYKHTDNTISDDNQPSTSSSKVSKTTGKYKSSMKSMMKDFKVKNIPYVRKR